MTQLSNYITKTEIDAPYRPTSEACGLPANVYYEQGFWEIERERLFSKTWMACAFESDLPGPGSVFPTSLCVWQVIITRDECGKINAFHNMCRHRSMRVVSEPCANVEKLVCPWHAWTYDLNGKLVATPNLGATSPQHKP